MQNTTAIVAASACAANKGMFINGPGKGRKVCPSCRRIVSGPTRRVCNHCHEEIPVFNTLSNKVKANVPPVATKPVKAAKPARTKTRDTQIVRTHTQLAKSYAKMEKDMGKLAAYHAKLAKLMG